jgi:hypothetical protein
MMATFPRRIGKSPFKCRLLTKSEEMMAPIPQESKRMLALLLIGIFLFGVWLAPWRTEAEPPPLDLSRPDPSGKPRIRVGQDRSVMEQPVRDHALDELLKRD